MKEELKYLNELIIKKLDFVMQWQPVFEEDPSKDIDDLICRLEKDIQLLKNIREKIKGQQDSYNKGYQDGTRAAANDILNSI